MNLTYIGKDLRKTEIMQEKKWYLWVDVKIEGVGRNDNGLYLVEVD